MNKEMKFTTSINRKVCWEDGFKEGKKEILKIINELKYCDRGYPHICENHPEDCVFIIDVEDIEDKLNKQKENIKEKEDGFNKISNDKR